VVIQVIKEFYVGLKLENLYSSTQDPATGSHRKLFHIVFCFSRIILRVPGALSLGLKRPEREADRSPPSSAEVKECVELYLHSPNTSSWRGAQLKSTGTTLPLRYYSPICA
jgi:hypothetical protein